MTILKCIGTFSAIFALLCMTGFDCPECDFKAQFIALGISVLIALICGLIVAKNEQL